MTTGLRWVAAALGMLIAMAVLGLCAAGTAAAHPTLLFTDPAADTAVPIAPQAITLMFNEPVTIGADAIVLARQERPHSTDRTPRPPHAAGRRSPRARQRHYPRAATQCAGAPPALTAIWWKRNSGSASATR